MGEKSDRWDGHADASESRATSGIPFDIFIQSVQEYAIFMLDPEGYITSWNIGAERIKGYTEEEIVGKHFSIFYSQTDRDRKHPRDNLQIARREGHFEEEGWRYRKNGTRFWAHVVITAVRDRSGKIIGFGKVTRDLSERRKQEERTKQLQREQTARVEVEAANRGKSQFLAAMSHELRTPLNAIMGYVDIMEMGVQGAVTEQQKASLDRIQKSSEHLLRLINDVLNFTRVQAGQVEYQIKDVPINDIINDVEPLIRPQLAAKDVAFTCTPCDDAVAMHADPMKVRQILLNLLTNAHKFTPEGGRVEIGCEMSGSRLCIRVRDTGRGIARERQAKIFEPFVQIDRHLHETSQKGVGLGLAISRDIARAMDGDLTVESEVGRGSTFTLELPRGGERS